MIGAHCCLLLQVNRILAPHVFVTQIKYDCMHSLTDDLAHCKHHVVCSVSFSDLKALNTLKISSGAAQTCKVASVKFGWPCQPQQSLPRPTDAYMFTS